jgi:hypothetical protein
MRYDNVSDNRKIRSTSSEEGCSNNKSEVDDNNNDNNFQGKLLARCGTLDDRTTAFMKWLSYESKQDHPSHSSNVPIILKKFIKDKQTILYDKNLKSEIDVEIKEGVPFCKYCNLDDCSHVGFTVFLEQMCENHSSDQELSVDDIIDT